jgi:hypothetical protein
MKIAHFLTIFLFGVTATLNGQSKHLSPDLTHPASSKQIRPTMILWNTGLVETITPALLGRRKVWRITHYSHDPTDTKTNEYDLFDLDETTLAPLRSVMNTAEYHLELIFAPKEVILRRTTDQANTTERISLSTDVQPEGPGVDVFVAGLPLAVGYKTRYAIVDRWGGHCDTRVKKVTLFVSKRTIEDTALGKHDIYELVIRPDDDSFLVREKVFAESPHFPVWVEYTRDGKTYPVSVVIAVVSRP